MRASLLVTLASLMGASNGLAPFHLSEPLGHEWYSNSTNYTTTWTAPFKITKTFLSGFSSGSMLSSNILRLDPQGFDGFGLLSGNLISNATYFTPANFSELETPNLKGMQVFSYIGSNDSFQYDHYMASQEFFKKGGANVTWQWIHDFTHVLPSNLPENKEYHPYASCAIHNVQDLPSYFAPPKKSVFRNCGYNLAYYMLSAWNPDQELKERALNHTELGNFHAFNQTPFWQEFANPKMSDTGYIYIPHACKDGNYCQAVMFLHGCMQSGEWWKDTEARRTGLLEYAATNNLIVIFPQNDDSTKLYMGEDQPMFDFKYCWSSMDSDDKFNDQISTLHNMLNSMVLGTDESDLVNMVQADASSAALAQKQKNRELNELDETLNLATQVLLI